MKRSNDPMERETICHECGGLTPHGRDNPIEADFFVCYHCLGEPCPCSRCNHEQVVSAACAYRQACRALDRNKNYGTAGRNQMSMNAITTMRALFAAVDALESK